MIHQIKPDQLLQIVTGYEDGTPVTLSNLANNYPGAGAIVESTAKLTFNNGGRGHSNDITAAEVFLESLDKAGYVIVKKELAEPKPIDRIWMESNVPETLRIGPKEGEALTRYTSRVEREVIRRMKELWDDHLKPKNPA